MAGPSPGQCPYDYHGFPSTAGATETLNHHKATGHFPDYSKPGDRYIITAKLPDGLEPGDAIVYDGEHWEHMPRPGKKPKKKAKIKLTDAFVKAVKFSDAYDLARAETTHLAKVSAGGICCVPDRRGLPVVDPKAAKQYDLKRLAEEVLKWVEIVEE